MDDVTAEYAVEQILPASPELRIRPVVTVAAKSDVGRVREHNEDKFEFYLPEDPSQLASRGLIFLVCDGMGGHAAGQIASELATKTFIDTYLHHPAAEPVAAAEAAVHAANRYVLDNSRAFPVRRGMGTTMSGLILCQDAAYTVQVGDSRVYRLRDGQLSRLTTDHTFIGEMVRNGTLTHEEASVHPQRHVLMRAVGVEDRVVPDVDAHDLAVGDLFLLCSDGLLDLVEDAEIAEILTLAPAPAAWSLVAKALQRGGNDNTTVLIVRVDALLAPAEDAT